MKTFLRIHAAISHSRSIMYAAQFSSNYSDSKLLHILHLSLISKSLGWTSLFSIINMMNQVCVSYWMTQSSTSLNRKHSTELLSMRIDGCWPSVGRVLRHVERSTNKRLTGTTVIRGCFSPSGRERAERRVSDSLSRERWRRSANISDGTLYFFRPSTVFAASVLLLCSISSNEHR